MALLLSFSTCSIAYADTRSRAFRKRSNVKLWASSALPVQADSRPDTPEKFRFLAWKNEPGVAAVMPPGFLAAGDNIPILFPSLFLGVFPPY